jgi:hypothetical protein
MSTKPSRPSMRDILEDERYFRQAQFRSQQVVVHLAQFRIWEMIPTNHPSVTFSTLTVGRLDSRASVPIQQCRSLDKLFPVPTPFALVRIVRIGRCVRVEVEQLPQVVLSKVPSRVFCLVHHTSGKILLLTPNDMSAIFGYAAARCGTEELTVAGRSSPQSSQWSGIGTRSTPSSAHLARLGPVPVGRSRDSNPAGYQRPVIPGSIRAADTYRIKQNQPVRAYQIDATTAGFRTE